MQRHVSPIAKQRISDFFTQEDGNVGRKNALMAGTVLSSVILAATLFGPAIANASWCPEWDYVCGQPPTSFTCCSLDQICCAKWDAFYSEWEFFCTYGDCP